MIENKEEVSRNLEKALQAFEQAKQRVANEKKKQNEKKRKTENHHKYIMGGIIVKYFPDCYSYDEGELTVSCLLPCRQGSVSRLYLKSKRKTKKALPHNPLSPMPKMKVRAVRNDKGEDTGKPR